MFRNITVTSNIRDLVYTIIQTSRNVILSESLNIPYALREDSSDTTSDMTNKYLDGGIISNFQVKLTTGGTTDIIE